MTITVSNVGLRFSDKKLFEDITMKFTPGNCYGLIGANGAGKSTFLKILSGEIEAQTGDVHITPGERLAVLKQDHFEFEEHRVLDVVIMGHQKLYAIMEEKNAIYMKEDFTDADGLRAAELEGEFGEMGGWESESDAAILLKGLGILPGDHDKLMKELDGGGKVKVLLAQALFGKPDILLLDEPTNHLDLKAIMWLEDFLANFENTVIAISHDRHFLNQVCTHIADLDYNKIKLFVGNYDFWYESSQLAQRMLQDGNKKKEEKIKELEAFVARFSANASKSKQATSRKKTLDKITLDDIQPSSRRYPFIRFQADREVGNDILQVSGLSKTIDGVKVLDNVSFTLDRDDKVAFVGNDSSSSALLSILAGDMEPDEGTFKWGVTTSQTYFPKDNTSFFEGSNLNLVEWLRQYSPTEDAESFLRGFLGRMLFSGDEVLKKVRVLSGGEKVRCMLSRMMLSGGNTLLLDEPTNHLDLESITALNDGLMDFKGVMLFICHDHQFTQSLANRVIDVTPGSFYNKKQSYDEYLETQK